MFFAQRTLLQDDTAEEALAVHLFVFGTKTGMAILLRGHTTMFFKREADAELLWCSSSLSRHCYCLQVRFANLRVEVLILCEHI